MSETYIHHVTLDSAHVRRSPRSEVADDVVDLLAPLIQRAVTGEHATLPAPVGGYTLTGGVHGQCCALTVWGPDPVAGGRRGDERVPLVTIGIAPHSRCGSVLWRSMHDDDARWLATSPDHVPPEPWCAVRIEPGAAAASETMAWLGDLERCLAWTWIERRS